MELLQRVAEAWADRTPRERSLALCVVGLTALFAVVLCARGALHTIDRLDGEISRMQSDIVNYSYQIARRQAVEARYAEVAAQHSSAWTESEIRDRLRQEIYRLSYRKPPRLDANGIPVTTDSEGEALVRIPELRGGQMVEGGEGYRAYQIDFEVPPAPFPDMLAYVEHLCGSPQSLRIDHIDLRRDPMRPEVAARIGLTRIVVDDPSGGVSAAADRSATASDVVLETSNWTCNGCEAALVDVTGDDPVLRFSGAAAGGNAYLSRMLPAGGIYRVEMELMSSVPLTVGVQFEGEPTNDAIPVPADREFYRCRFEFAVPEGSGGRVSVGVPLVAWKAPDAVVTLRRMLIEPVRDVADDV